MASGFTALTKTLQALKALTQETPGVTDVLDECIKELTELERAAAARTPTVEKHNNRTPLAKQRNLDRVPTFAGKRDEFPTFDKKVLNFVADEPGLRDLLKKISTDLTIRKKELTKDILNDLDLESNLKIDIQDLSRELHAMLVAVTDGTPGALVEAADGNGFEAWRILQTEYHSVTSEGRRQLLSKVIQPTRVKTYQEILPAQAEWEKYKTRYMELSGKRDMDDDLLVTSYMGILPMKLQEAVHGLEKDLTTLNDLQMYVRKQVTSMMDQDIKDRGLLHTEDGDAKNNYPDDGQKPVTQSQYDELMSMIKGGKGKGGKGGGFGGKGKGGTGCWHCGGDHLKANCPELDKIMEEKRAQGKGGAGPKGYPGQWGSQGQWNGWQVKGGLKGGAKGGYPGQGWKGKGKGLYGMEAFGVWLDTPGQQACGREEYEAGFMCDTCGPNEEEFVEYWDMKRGCKSGCCLGMNTSNAFEALSCEEEQIEYESEFPKALGSEVKNPEKSQKPKKIMKMPKKTPQKERLRKGKKKDVEEDIDMILSQLEEEFKAQEAGKAIEEKGEVAFECKKEDDEAMIVTDEDFEEEHAAWNVHEPQYSEYLKASAVMDSGAADHVTNRELAPTVEVVPSEGSRRGQHYITANGKRIPNEGQQRLAVMTEEGAHATMDWQITDVRRPLCSVSKLADRGNRVIFGAGGGVIHNVKSGRLTPFRRVGGVYALDLYVRQNASSGFTRQS